MMRRARATLVAALCLAGCSGRVESVCAGSACVSRSASLDAAAAIDASYPGDVYLKPSIDAQASDASMALPRVDATTPDASLATGPFDGGPLEVGLALAADGAPEATFGPPGDAGSYCAPTCDLGDPCFGDGDCASSLCTQGTCASPNCSPSCPDNSACDQDTDCASSNCSNYGCAPPDCSPTCDPGSACGADTDCTSMNCVGAQCM